MVLLWRSNCVPSLPRSPPQRYFHYTDAAVVQFILKTDKVLMSTSAKGDAAYGDGVYFTTLHPTRSAYDRIMQNNWCTTHRDRVAAGHPTDVVLEFELPTELVEDWGPGRDVHLLHDQDLSKLCG